ncbi:hypothetical protein KIS4809_1731 [Bacillus sp. ZZV12-4809]|nr:hypothetical protein KIS4809_1731 [Bacillus sp. ZZV12-4809]
MFAPNLRAYTIIMLMEQIGKWEILHQKRQEGRLTHPA